MTYQTTLPWMATLVRHDRWTHEKPKKVDAQQPEPSMGEAVQGSSVARTSQASQSPSQMGNKSRVTGKMGSIKESKSVLAIANYVVALHQGELKGVEH